MNTMLTDCTSDRDVRDRYVLPALTRFAHLFDVDAIVADVIVGWTIEPTPHAIVVHYDDFWTIVERHVIPDTPYPHPYVSR